MTQVQKCLLALRLQQPWSSQQSLQRTKFAIQYRPFNLLYILITILLPAYPKDLLVECRGELGIGSGM